MLLELLMLIWIVFDPAVHAVLAVAAPVAAAAAVFPSLLTPAFKSEMSQ
jgi:hypothetical protein